VAEGWALTTTEASEKPKRGRKPKVEE
jgi:hypothetical protein